MTAVPNENYIFSGWFVNGALISSDLKYSFKVVKPLVLTANFTPKTYLITLSASVGGTVQGGGNCKYGETVTIKAIPDQEYVFISWYDEKDQLISNANPYVFTCTNNRTIKAKFEQKKYNVKTKIYGGYAKTDKDVYIAPKNETVFINVISDPGIKIFGYFKDNDYTTVYPKTDLENYKVLKDQ